MSGAVTGFEIGARGFVVAGGSDDGLSLFEVLPDRSLLERAPLVNVQGGALDSISALATTSFGSEVQVIAAGQPGLTLAVLDRGCDRRAPDRHGRQRHDRGRRGGRSDLGSGRQRTCCLAARGTTFSRVARGGIS